MAKKAKIARKLTADVDFRRGRPKKRTGRAQKRQAVKQVKKSRNCDLATIYRELGRRPKPKKMHCKVSAAEVQREWKLRHPGDVCPSLATVKRVVSLLPVENRRPRRPAPALPCRDADFRQPRIWGS